MNYSHILVGIDLTEDTEKVTNKALALAEKFSAQLDLAYVMEPINFSLGGDLPADFSGLEEEMNQQATKQIHTFAQQKGISADNVHIRHGRTQDVMHELAAEIGADLIVIGSHARHGLALLLGSTASSIVHGAECDVLAVRV